MEANNKRLIDEKKFTLIKTLLSSGGFDDIQVAKIADVCRYTVSKIKHCASFEDYEAQKRAAAELAAKRYAEKTSKQDEVREALQNATEQIAEEKAKKNYDFTESQLDTIIEKLTSLEKIALQIATLVGLPKEDSDNKAPF